MAANDPPTVELEPQSLRSGSAESDGAEIWRSALAVACRGMAVGAGLHAGVKILSGINSGRVLNNPVLFLSRLLNADTVRFSAFVGLSGATYKLVIALLRRKSKKKCGWHAVVAGMATGLVSSLDDPTRRRTLSLFVGARALGALVMTLHRRGFLPSIPYSVVLLFGLCQSFIVVATTRHPELLPQSYYRSILRWSLCYTDENLAAYYRHSPSSELVSCSSMLHQGSCHAFALNDFYQCMVLYIKIHLTLYSLPLLLFRTSKLLVQPVEALQTLAQNTVVSSLFLAVTGAVIKYSLCLLRNAWARAPPVPLWIPAASGFAGVVGFLVERESRRLELLYYVIPQVLYGFWRLLCIKKPLGLHKIPYGSVGLFVFSLMVIMHAYEREKASISPLMNRALKFLLGE